MAHTHSVAKKMRLWKPTAKNWMKIDPYYRRQKSRPMNLASDCIRFMRIFAGVLWRGQHYCIELFSPLSPFHWPQNIWPWVTLTGYFALNSVFAPVIASWYRATSGNNCVKTNADRHTLSAVWIFGRNSCFWQCKVCTDIRSGSLDWKETLKDCGIVR